MLKFIHSLKTIAFLGLLFLVIGNVNAQSIINGQWDLLTNDNDAKKMGSMTASNDSVYLSLNDHANQIFDVKYKINEEGLFSGQSIGDIVVVIQGRMAKNNNKLFGLTLRLRNRKTDERFTYIVKGVKKD